MSAVPTPAQALTQLLAGAWLAQAIAVTAQLGVGGERGAAHAELA